jgi:hypothetical protein
MAEWKGRKWYLSSHMTEDEVLKTCFVAFQAAVQHEVMEGFKLGGIPPFNPHASIWTLRNASIMEVTR